jgi:DNA polymerase III, beta subunit
MKFTVQKSEMTEAVMNIQRAVSSKTSIPALEGILLNAVNNTLELNGYDLELGMNTIIPATVEEEGKSVLNAKLFCEIVRKSPAEHITISVDEKNMATIESGYSNFSIVGIPPEEFPEFPKIADGTALSISSELLKSMIRQTIFATAESDAKPIHQGCMFNIEKGQLDVVAVDGYRLAKRTEQIEFPEDISFVVPGKTLNEINKLIKDDQEDTKIFIGKRQIQFKIESYTVISSLLEGEFLNYKATIPAETTTEALVNTRETIESVERVSLLITDRLKSPLRCTFENDTLKILCTTSMGRANDSINVHMDGERLEIGFNNRYLLEALRNTECDEVRIQMNTPLSPMKIVPKEGDSFLFLVLPVRLKNE